MEGERRGGEARAHDSGGEIIETVTKTQRRLKNGDNVQSWRRKWRGRERERKGKKERGGACGQHEDINGNGVGGRKENKRKKKGKWKR